MAPLSHRIEGFLGKLFASRKNRDAGLLSRKAAVLSGREPSVTVTSSELGATSPGTFTADKHEALGQNAFPELAWSFDDPAGPDAAATRSWLLIVEDADVPLPSPIVHGLFYDIPAAKRELHAADFAEVKETKGLLQGGFRYGKNRPGTVYLGPRPIINHGPHRYFLTVVGLSTDVLLGAGSSATLTKEKLLDPNGPLKGKVTGWGEYIGSFERKL